VVDGREVRVPGCEGGYFVGPTVLDEVRPDQEAACEEIFGPVLSVLRACDLDEAIALIERLPFGNAASIYTQDGAAARAFQYRVNVGNVGINVGVAAPMAFFPFGGRKASFFGTLHGQGRDAIEFCTDKKVVISRWY
jgi:malonate-semialdehyde dehydrogenase (acetylating)/methylmalonate-semialdehyde dehydrogenase